ncbi:hypothetical protein SprV_0200847200 [Sparganum proliferum]
MVLPDSYAEAGRRPSQSVRNNFYYGGLNVSFKTKSEEIDLSFSNTNLSYRNPEFRQTLELKPFSGLSILTQLTDWEDFLGTFKVASDRRHLVHELSYCMKGSQSNSSSRHPSYKIGTKTTYRSESLVGECGLTFHSLWPRVYAATLLG